MKVFLLILCGIGGGILGGMGMGGGTVLIPFLTLGLGIGQHVAQWINVITFIPMSVVALIVHAKNRLIRKDKILPILITSVLAAAACSYFSLKLKAELLKKLFGGFLVLLGVISLIASFVPQKKSEHVLIPPDE